MTPDMTRDGAAPTGGRNAALNAAAPAGGAGRGRGFSYEAPAGIEPANSGFAEPSAAPAMPRDERPALGDATAAHRHGPGYGRGDPGGNAALNAAAVDRAPGPLTAPDIHLLRALRQAYGRALRSHGWDGTTWGKGRLAAADALIDRLAAGVAPSDDEAERAG